MKETGWVRVKREEELREAVLVELRPCGFCGKTERFILFHRVVTTMNASLTAEGDMKDQGGCWSIAPGLCLHPGRPFDPSAAIATGRLWRRADEQDEQHERQREKVTAGDRAP
jgi:hypothetical protein